MLFFNHCPLTRRLAGDRNKSTLFQDELGQQINHHCHDQQQHCQSGASLQLISADGLIIDLRCKRVIPTGDRDRIAEVSNTFNKHQQECIDDTRQGQRDRYLAEGLQSGRAHVPRCFFNGRVDRTQYAVEQQVGHREEGKDLCKQEAPEAVDVIACHTEQCVRNEALVAKQQDNRQ